MEFVFLFSFRLRSPDGFSKLPKPRKLCEAMYSKRLIGTM